MARSIKAALIVLLAVGLITAMAALLGYIPSEQNRVAQRGYAEVRAIATSAEIELERDEATNQPIGMSVYLPGTVRVNKETRIAKGYYHPETLALHVVFEGEPTIPGRPRDKTMTTTEFANEIEQRARAARGSMQ